jgi:predicted nucleotidyltransferase
MSSLSQQDIVQRVAECLLAEPGLTLAVVYGSVAVGTIRPDSDVDIAVLSDRPLDVGRKMDLAERLERCVSRTIDVVDLSVLSGTILRQVLCRGRVVINKDPAALQALIRKMIYNQTDVMPLVRRTLRERQMRFAYG